MGKLSFEIYTNDIGWLTAGHMDFHANGEIAFEYDLDYAVQALGAKDERAISLAFPVQIPKFKGLPGFIMDLIPQGEPLKRILARYSIQGADNFFEILQKVPLASPGNIRIQEAWADIEKQRSSYSHPGFPLSDILQHKEEFVEYMERSGAPVGGTSGVGGGSPKFLIREDFSGNFHAEGWLENSKTKSALLVKFPYTDSENSKDLSRLEKKYYDLIQDLPVHSGAKIDIHDDILFIKRFDRPWENPRTIRYWGLESFYSAHNISTHGTHLLHEDNLQLIKKHSSDAAQDILEYVKRDILNRALSNTDNHGRNISFLKQQGQVRLSPIYDLTAMRFFKGDLIVELTKWRPEHIAMKDRVEWISKTFLLDKDWLKEDLQKFFACLVKLDERMKAVGISPEWIEKTKDDRVQALASLKAFF